jgi:diguanylate cyclase (GGDEF)-like protein
MRHLGGLVDDVIVRPLNQGELLARLGNLLRLRRISLELKKQHDRVARLSVTDDVSGFQNTRFLHRYLDRRLTSPGTKKEPLSLVFLDLDNFKRVVDAHGHLLGAHTLREVARAIHGALDEDDRLVRYGGDEFVVMLPRQAKMQALSKVERMRSIIATTRFLRRESLNIRLTASFGLAAFPEDARDKRALLAAADQCLFHSKSAGKNRISLDHSKKALVT